ncbi:hypothetical protein [Exiguobacterium alkaliphilum]|uniref:hypothetical protein n=1 Tax=Exiguobacterium alkaliphilum TaxID=1428684 RepID=UPI001BAB9C7A|nr:hypothetical protein [Exiguobacterium alkaliphilum]QUE86337.1 hypothetical protein KB235_14770 [Exiguobacterium alkaliphilum]
MSEFNASLKEKEWSIYWKEHDLHFVHELPLKNEEITAVQDWLKHQMTHQHHSSAALVTERLWRLYPLTCLIGTSMVALHQEDRGFWTLFSDYYSVSINFVGYWKTTMHQALIHRHIFTAVDGNLKYYLTALIHSGITSVYALENIYNHFISHVIEDRRQLPSAIKQVTQNEWPWNEQLNKPVKLYIEQSINNPEPLLRLKEFFMEQRKIQSFPPFMRNNLQIIQAIVKKDQQRRSRRQFIFWDELASRPRIKLPKIYREDAKSAYWRIGDTTVQCSREMLPHAIRFHPHDSIVDFSPHITTACITIDGEDEVYELPSTYPMVFKQKEQSEQWELLRGKYVTPGTEIIIVKPSSYSTNDSYHPISNPKWHEYEYKKLQLNEDVELYFHTPDQTIYRQLVTSPRAEVTIDTRPLFYSDRSHYTDFPSLRFHDLDIHDLLHWKVEVKDNVFGLEDFNGAFRQDEDDVLLDIRALKLHRNLLEDVTLKLRNTERNDTYKFHFTLLPQDFSYKMSQSSIQFESKHLQRVRVDQKSYAPHQQKVTIPLHEVNDSVSLTLTIAGHPLYTTSFSKTFYEYEIISSEGRHQTFTQEEIQSILIRVTTRFQSAESIHAHLIVRNQMQEEHVPIPLKRNRISNLVSLSICQHVINRFQSGQITLSINGQTELIGHFTDELHSLLSMDESYTVHLSHPLPYEISFKIFHPYSLENEPHIFTFERGKTYKLLHPFPDSRVILNGMKQEESSWFDDDTEILFPKLIQKLDHIEVYLFIDSLDETTWGTFIDKLNQYGAAYLRALESVANPLLIEKVLLSPDLIEILLTRFDAERVSWERWVTLFGVYLWKYEHQKRFYEKAGIHPLIHSEFGHLQTFSALNPANRQQLRQQFRLVRPQDAHPLEYDVLDSCNRYLADEFYQNPTQLMGYKQDAQTQLSWIESKLAERQKEIPLRVQELLSKRTFPPKIELNQYPTFLYVSAQTKLLALGTKPNLSVKGKLKIYKRLNQIPALSIKDVCHNSYHFVTAWEDKQL